MITTPSTTIWRASRERRRVSGVVGAFADAVRNSIAPNSLAWPVAVTRQSPLPCVTAVPPCTIDVRSASGVSTVTGATSFVTGSDSPVSADSSTSKDVVSNRRASAATRSPALTRRTSPGTILSAGISTSIPSRMTIADCVNACERASIARSATASCQNPNAPLTMRIEAIAIPSILSPIAMEMTAAATSNATSGSINWFSARRKNGRLLARRGRFGP